MVVKELRNCLNIMVGSSELHHKLAANIRASEPGPLPGVQPVMRDTRQTLTIKLRTFLSNFLDFIKNSHTGSGYCEDGTEDWS